jgi:hypothetical protein
MLVDPAWTSFARLGVSGRCPFSTWSAGFRVSLLTWEIRARESPKESEKDSLGRDMSSVFEGGRKEKNQAADREWQGPTLESTLGIQLIL